MLKRHEYWRINYRNNRYLVTASIAEIENRSKDINTNLQNVNALGQLSVLDPAIGENWMILWTDILEELQLRNIDYRTLDLMQKPTWFSYPKPPRGLQILKGKKLPEAKYLARIGKRQHIIDMYSRGKIRIAPAASYSDPSLNTAIYDEELEVRTIRSGKNINIKKIDKATGSKIGPVIKPIGDLKYFRRLEENFYVLCMSQVYQPRLLDDFKGEGLIIITNPLRFMKRIEKSVKSVRPEMKMTAAPVYYFDPYKPDPKHVPAHYAKNFRYWYQQEYRYVWTKRDLDLSSKPFFIEIGSLKDIADMYVFPNKRSSRVSK